MPNTYGTTITAELIGERTDENNWPHFEWRVTLTRDGLAGAGSGGQVKWSFPYRMGLGHVQTPCGKPQGAWRGETPCQHVRCQGKWKPAPPDLYAVFCSLKADDTMGRTYNEWCGDYGFDTDSRKAMDTYLACQKSEADSRRFFGEDWLRIISDEDYE
jgi:hypothetical protein